MKKITDYAELVKAKHALNKTIAPVEDGANMAGSYTSGKQFIRDSVLYSALTSIAAGTAWSSLTLDTDYEVADDVSTQIAAVNQTLTNDTYNVNDTAITEVASDDILPIYDTSATGKKKIAVSNFIGGLVSNPNLLDNPWFTVNQRGATSMSTAGYFCDRWKVNTGNVGQSCSLTNNGLVVTASSGGNDNVLQFISEELGANLVGKTVTLSVKFKAATNVKIGVRKSSAWSFILQKSVQSASDEIVSVTGVVSSDTSHNFKITISASDESSAYSATIEAVKLELGSVSTLAQDTAPNYATELLKCQRYFTIARQGLVFAGEESASNEVKFTIPTPVKMRAVPTVTNISGISIFTNVGATNSTSITSQTGHLATETGVSVKIGYTASSTVTNYSIANIGLASDAYLSADL